MAVISYCDASAATPTHFRHWLEWLSNWISGLQVDRSSFPFMTPWQWNLMERMLQTWLQTFQIPWEKMLLVCYFSFLCKTKSRKRGSSLEGKTPPVFLNCLNTGHSSCNWQDWFILGKVDNVSSSLCHFYLYFVVTPFPWYKQLCSINTYSVNGIHCIWLFTDFIYPLL